MEINHTTIVPVRTFVVPSQPSTAGGDVHKFNSCDVWVPQIIGGLIGSCGNDYKISSIRWLRAMYPNLGLFEAKLIVEHYIKTGQ